MSQAEGVELLRGDAAAEGPDVRWLGVGVLGPVALAVLVVAVVALAIVMRTADAWRLLGAGRGLVPEKYYPYSGFVVVLATALGQFAGWAAGSALLAYVVGLITRRSVTAGVMRAAMAVVYLGFAAAPLLAYHVLFGQPLLGLPRDALGDWLLQTYPDAHLLLYTLHPFIDLSLAPLAVAVLAILSWARDERLARRAVQFVFVLLVLATSLAVALSLGIHSVLAHIRL